jgi:hypothetical protein
MMKRSLSVIAAAALLALVTATTGASKPVAHRSPAINDLLAQMSGTKAPRVLPNGLFAPQLSGGVQQTIAEQQRTSDAGIQASLPPPTINSAGCSNTFTRAGYPDNVRTNLDCGYRFQSEEWVAVNPTDPSNIVASQNDSKLNGNSTGVDFSTDGGKHWGDSVLSVRRHNIPDAPGGVWSWDAYSDPAHAFDSQGNLYYTALGFDFAQDGYDGLFVWKSNSCLKGSVLHAPGSGSCDPFSPPFDANGVAVRSNFDDPAFSDDKELMAADAWPHSPYRDNVYITWTIFDFHCGGSFCASPIYFSKSSDGGMSWSDPMVISGSSSEWCAHGDLFDPSADPHACNFDQGSDPVVGPDGTIYVVFNNSNTTKQSAQGAGGVAQQLLVKSTDGGSTWSDPVRVGKDYATQPFSVPGNKIPSCPLFRQCLPPNGYRMDDFPAMGIDAKTGTLAVFWNDFRNGGPCATDPTFGVPVEPCANHNQDVVVATSTDDGATWGPTRLVSQTPGGGSQPDAQWQAWGAVGKGGTLFAGYYDRQYGCEASGCNDITLATSTDAGKSWTYQRITTSSMPNLGCARNPFQCGFLGDYMSIQAANNKVYLVWGDTRGRGGAFDEDIYFAKVQQ